MQLTSLHLLHGSLAPGLVLEHWSSLKQLQELKLLPAEQAGLADAQVGLLCGGLCAVSWFSGVAPLLAKGLLSGS
jgi:hypothetical protein